MARCGPGEDDDDEAEDGEKGMGRELLLPPPPLDDEEVPLPSAAGSWVKRHRTTAWEVSASDHTKAGVLFVKTKVTLPSPGERSRTWTGRLRSSTPAVCSRRGDTRVKRLDMVRSGVPVGVVVCWRRVDIRVWAWVRISEGAPEGPSRSNAPTRASARTVGWVKTLSEFLSCCSSSRSSPSQKGRTRI